MAFTIAFAGKGGTGKTTLAGMTIRFLLGHRRGPVLAVDADPNSCLDQALGVRAHATIGMLREESLEIVRRSGARPGGMSTEELFDYQVQQAIVEADGFDLLVMGRPEGPGCYCAANNIIRKYTDRLSTSYPYVVIDNEAGLEHLSRRTTNRVDLLIMVSDPTVKGINAAQRINGLANELRLDVGGRILVVNRDKENDGAIEGLTQETGLPLAGNVPDDPMVGQIDLEGRSIFTLSPESDALTAFFRILHATAIP